MELWTFKGLVCAFVYELCRSFCKKKGAIQKKKILTFWI